jgi:hypothetical protein
MHGEMGNADNILDGKPDGKKTIGRPRRRWKDIRINFGEIGWEGVN